MTFASPAYFFLLLLLIPYIIWYLLQHLKSTPSIRVSSLDGLHHAPKTLRNYLLHLPFVLRIACFVLAVIALARPQTTNNWSTQQTDGIDIMLCMDVSTSMLAEDLKPNRIEAAKEVAIQFITGRPNDNIGLTLFAGEAFTQCPMTVDHAVLLNLLNGMRVDMAQNGMIEDGTAIGMGIANALTRLKNSKAKSKVIILLTDGTNTTGQISPNTAADIAKSFGVRVYTIGVTLASIARKTDGEFYRATNTQKLFEVYKEIDKLEKTKMNVKKYSKRYEAFGLFLLLSILALISEIILKNTYLQRIP